MDIELAGGLYGGSGDVGGVVMSLIKHMQCAEGVFGPGADRVVLLERRDAHVGGDLEDSCLVGEEEGRIQIAEGAILGLGLVVDKGIRIVQFLPQIAKEAEDRTLGVEDGHLLAARVILKDVVVDRPTGRAEDRVTIPVDLGGAAVGGGGLLGLAETRERVGGHDDTAVLLDGDDD